VLGRLRAQLVRQHACPWQLKLQHQLKLFVLLAVVAAEADAGRAKKQKRDKKREKDQGKAGAKGKKGKGGKAKQEAGSSEEEEEEEEQSEEEQRGGHRRGAGAGWLDVGCHTTVDPACTISASAFCGCAVPTPHTCTYVLQAGRTQARAVALHWDPFDGRLQAPCCVCHQQRVPVQYPLVCPPAPPPREVLLKPTTTSSFPDPVHFLVWLPQVLVSPASGELLQRRPRSAQLTGQLCETSWRGCGRACWTHNRGSVW
jgi:hypothetical protein